MSSVLNDLKPLDIRVVNHLPNEYEVEKGTIYLMHRVEEGVEYYDEYIWHGNDFVLIDSIEVIEEETEEKENE